MAAAGVRREPSPLGLRPPQGDNSTLLGRSAGLCCLSCGAWLPHAGRGREGRCGVARSRWSRDAAGDVVAATPGVPQLLESGSRGCQSPPGSLQNPTTFELRGRETGV